jgi:hypothetical protein
MMFRATVEEAERAMLSGSTDLEVAYEAIGARIRELVAAGVTMPEVSPQYHEQLIAPSGLLKASDSGFGT